MKKQETIGFQLSAAVSVERMGYVLKALFDNGCPPDSFNLQALVGVMGGTRTNGHAINAENAETAPQIEHKKRGRPKGSTTSRMQTMRDEIMVYMQSHKQASRPELHTHLAAAQPKLFHRQIVDTAVLEFVKQGLLKRPSVGVLTMTEAGHRAMVQVAPEPEPKPEPKPEPAPEGPALGLVGNSLFIYSLLHAEPNRVFFLKDVRDGMKAAGRAPGSAKDTVLKLVRRKYVRRIAPGKYQL
jgi:hypothetical protein